MVASQSCKLEKNILALAQPILRKRRHLSSERIDNLEVICQTCYYVAIEIDALGALATCYKVCIMKYVVETLVEVCIHHNNNNFYLDILFLSILPKIEWQMNLCIII